MKSPREIQAIANVLGGVPILGVIPGSPADRAGLRYGDIVISLNGTQTKSFADFLRVHDTARDEIVIEVFREGTMLDVRMNRASRYATPEPELDSLPSLPKAHKLFSFESRRGSMAS